LLSVVSGVPHLDIGNCRSGGYVRDGVRRCHFFGRVASFRRVGDRDVVKLLAWGCRSDWIGRLCLHRSGQGRCALRHLLHARRTDGDPVASSHSRNAPIDTREITAPAKTFGRRLRSSEDKMWRFEY